MSYKIQKKNFKANIREVNVGDIKINSATSLPFMRSEQGNCNPLFAIEVLMNIPKNYSSALEEYWGDIISDMPKWVDKVLKLNADIIALKFNINDESEIEKAVALLKEILTLTKKSFIITGSNKKNLDILLLPELVKILDRPCVIGIAEQDTYKSITELVSNNNHAIIARTPIDINLAKELNILLTESGISADKILIDTNMAALGYGLDYGYSIMERVKLSGLEGDEMLNFPIIAFVGEEAWKAKEARVDDYDKNYGDFTSRAIAWESATATSLMLAGADVIVLWHPEVLTQLKNFTGEI